MAFIEGINMNRDLGIFIKNFFRRETVLRALRVALVVAPILILINHHDAIMELSFTPKFYFKCILTFFVPYMVSAYSSAKTLSAHEVKF